LLKLARSGFAAPSSLFELIVSRPMQTTILPNVAELAIVASGPPLDYSFKELKSCMEMETEEPRSGGKRKPPTEKDAGPVLDEAEVAEPASPGTTATQPLAGEAGKAANPALATGTSTAILGASGKSAATQGVRTSPHMKRVIRKVTLAVKLNNNSIETVTDLPPALEFVMDNPIQNLQWIDLSFNQLRSIEPALLQFQQMKALYLHGNHIKSLPSTERLRKLPKLISLTLNGNPIECCPSYRMYVIGALHTLRTLDHSTITEDEIGRASAWFEAHRKRMKIRKEKMEEAYLNSLNE